MSTGFTHRISLLAGTAVNTADALGESLRYQLRCSFNVLHIHLSPLLAGALYFIQVRKPRAHTNEGII